MSVALKPADAAVLRLFYEATGGPNWKTNDGWGDPVNCTTGGWANDHFHTFGQMTTAQAFGVTCTADGEVEVLCSGTERSTVRDRARFAIIPIILRV